MTAPGPNGPGRSFGLDSTSMAENLVLLAFVLAPLVLAAGLRAFFARVAPGASGRHGPGKVVAGNLLVFALLLALVLLGGEVYFRFLDDRTDAFALTKTTQRWLARHYRKNAAGVRDSMPDYDPVPAPGKRRVTFVGDSFTAGHGVADVEERFANLIRHREPGWEIHVLAVNGMDTGQELRNLRRSIADGYRVDRVVLVYCLNDIADLSPEWQATLKSLASYRPPGPFGWSYLLNQLYARWFVARHPDLRDYYHVVVAAYRGPLWAEQQERLAALDAVVRGGGGRLLVVTFPFLGALDAYGEYEPIHRQLEAFWSGRGVPHLELLDVYRGHSAAELVVGSRDPHPNEKAHAMAADAIDAFVRSNLDR